MSNVPVVCCAFPSIPLPPITKHPHHRPIYLSKFQLFHKASSVKKLPIPHKFTQNTTKNSQRKQPCSEMAIEHILYPLLVAFRALSASSMIIPDCDEVFNYWEPLNFLVRGFGKQTWEYSPEYAIRSWAYLLPYYLIVKPFFALNLGNSYYGFYLVRTAIVVVAGHSELRLYRKLRKYLPRVASWFLFFSAVSTGMSHGAVALLPSSFALFCQLHALSDTVDFYYTKSSSSAWNAILWHVIAAVVGWPFSLALAVPLSLYCLGTMGKKAIKFVIMCAGGCATVVVVVVAVDSYLYRKLVLVPANIVLYNVLFADEESGPNIFGTEPLSYYVMNLLLNFNVIAVAAVLAPMAAFVSHVTRASVKSSKSNSKGKSQSMPLALSSLFMLPLMLWLMVFGSQPHKEERFLYPVYPHISVCAAVTVSAAVEVLELGKNKLLLASKKVAVVFLAAFVLIVSFLRTLNLVLNYSAPLSVYAHVPQNTSGTVCVGREWYRYPSSFFLPDNTRLSFVKSSFDGLLPGDFPENMTLTKAVSAVPAGMNNKNLFDSGKVINFANCNFYVDIDEKTNGLEPNVLSRDLEGSAVVASNWSVIHCEKFIDISQSYGMARIVHIPEKLHPLLRSKLEYHRYCLLERS